MERALALDPDLAEAHASKAFRLRNHRWDFAGSEELRLRDLCKARYVAPFYWATIDAGLGDSDAASACRPRVARADAIRKGGRRRAAGTIVSSVKRRRARPRSSGS